MAEPVIMPKQGQSVESCILSKWHKEKGDKVEKGDLLFSYETDKASFEEEAPASGVILDIFFEEGDDVPCFQNVCVIGQEGEAISEFRPPREGEDVTAGPKAGGQPAEGTGERPEGTNAAGNPKGKSAENGVDSGVQEQGIATGSAAAGADSAGGISPRARNLAEKIGADYRFAAPSGPHGRIIERDILALQDSGRLFTLPARDEVLGHSGTPGGMPQGSGLGGRVTTGDLARPPLPESTGQGSGQTSVSTEPIIEPAYEEESLPHIRKIIAKTMHQSLASAAQLTLNASFDATAILAYRKKLKEAGDSLGLANITLNDILLFAVARTLGNYRGLNAHFLEDKIRYFKQVNLGVATDTDRGLMVPTLFGADRLSLNEISVQAKKLIGECRAGTINPDLLKNGSFTVTNLGTLGVESFTPILNPPQTGILGVDTIVQRARQAGNGEIAFYPAMGLSLTFDHRAVDGAPAARFLKDLITNLENFTILLAR